MLDKQLAAGGEARAARGAAAAREGHDRCRGHADDVRVARVRVRAGRDDRCGGGGSPPRGRRHRGGQDEPAGVRRRGLHVQRPVRAPRATHGTPSGPAAAPPVGRRWRWRRAWRAIATATDGGGSIRIPAAYCGLVGLKPTNGVIGRDPIPDWIDLSTDGPFSTQADDLEVLLDVLRGPTPGDPSTQEARPSERDPSIGRVFSIERFTDFGPLPAEAAEPFAAASARFAGGVRSCDRTGDARNSCSAIGVWTTTGSTSAASSTPTCSAVRGSTSTWTSSRPRSGTSSRGASPARWRSIRPLAAVASSTYGRSTICSATTGCWCRPCMATDACPAEGWEEGTGAEPYVCAAQNITGHPALSVPAGFYPSGVPFGLQVTAPRFRDDLLLDVAETMGTGAAVAVDGARIRAVRLGARQSRSHTAASAA